MTNVPAGQSYAEANPTTFSVLMQNVGCLTHNMGSQAGRWWRLTCAVSVTGAGTLAVRISGAVVNVSGIEMRRAKVPTAMPLGGGRPARRSGMKPGVSQS
jgi:hypothetical protein